MVCSKAQNFWFQQLPYVEAGGRSKLTKCIFSGSDQRFKTKFKIAFINKYSEYTDKHFGQTDTPALQPQS